MRATVAKSTRPSPKKALSLLLLLATANCGGERSGAIKHPPEAPPLQSAAGASSQGPTASLLWDHSTAKIPVTEADPSWGQPDAPVTIVEFTDLQCPFCGRVSPTIERIKETYGPSQVRVVSLHLPLPFHDQAYPAAVAASTIQALAGSEAFFRFKALVLEHQRDLSETNFVTWAKAAGVDETAFRDAFSGRLHARKVDADMALAKRLGITGTPAFRINGITLSGAQPYAQFAEVIDQQLAAARQLVGQGVRAVDLYVALTDQNFGAAEPEPQEKTPPPEELGAWKIPVQRDDPIRGPQTAPVTIVVFSDFECPFCSRVEATLTQVREHYGTNVRVIWKDNPLPFHKQAMPAAILGRLVLQRRGNAAFWTYHDKVFETHPELTEIELKDIAELYKVRWADVESGVEKGRLKARVEASMELASDFNARGTPNFFINGIRLQGARPYEAFQEIIDAELEKATALEKRGVPRARLYQEIIKDAKEPPPPPRRDAPLPEAGRPSLGPAQAPIVIQEWSDFQCPFCKRVQPTLESLRKEFPTQWRLVWRHLPLPFHEQAPIAAEIAEEVLAQKGNQAFWAYHDRVFESQSEPEGLAQENLVNLAVELGADRDKLRVALDGHKHRAKLDADAAIAKDISISGTPAFVINGYFVSGAQPLAAFRRAMRRALDDKKYKRKLPPVTLDDEPED